MRVEVNGLGLVDILLAKAVKEIPALLFCVPAGEFEAVVVRLGRCGLVKSVARLYNLSADNLIVNVEVVCREGRLTLLGHNVDAEVVDIEALDEGVRLAGANGLHGGGVVGDAIHVDRAVTHAAVEEANVNRTIGLDDVAVGTKQSHVDGYGVLHNLAVLLDDAGDGFDDVLAVHLVGADGRTLREHALGCGHLDNNVANVGIALVGRATHVSNNFLGVEHLGLGGRCVLSGAVSRRLLRGGLVLGRLRGHFALCGGLGLRGGLLRGGFLGRDGLGRDDDLLAAGQVRGGDGVGAGLVSGQHGLAVADGGDLLALVGGNRELEVESVGNVNGLGVRLGRDVLLGAILSLVGQLGAADLYVEGDGGVGLLGGSLSGGLGLGGVLDDLLGSRGGVGGLLLACLGIRGRLVRLGGRCLGGRGVLRGLVGRDVLGAGRRVGAGAVGRHRVRNHRPVTGKALGDALGYRLDIGGLHHHGDGEDGHECDLPPLHRLAPRGVVTLAPLTHTNHHSLVPGAPPDDARLLTRGPQAECAHGPFWRHCNTKSGRGYLPILPVK